MKRGKYCYLVSVNLYVRLCTKNFFPGLDSNLSGLVYSASALDHWATGTVHASSENLKYKEH